MAEELSREELEKNYPGRTVITKEEFEKKLEEEDYDFSNRIFGFEVDLLGFEFDHGVSFSKSVFLEKISFGKAQFSKYADFGKVQFSGDVIFWETQFSKYCYFRAAQFSGKVYFWKTQFSKYSSFSAAQFSGQTHFWGAQFSRNANFTKSQFSEIASFREAHFSEIASFKEAQFSEYADFGKVQFSGDAYFSETQFSGKANFRNVQIHGSGGGDFDGAHFKSIVYFKDLSKSGKSIAILSFEGAHFEKTVFFDGSSFAEFKLAGCIFNETSFEHTTIGYADQNSFRIIKNSLIKSNDKIGALEYRVREMNAFWKQIKFKPLSSDWYVLLLNKLSNNHGSNWQRGILFTLSVALLVFPFHMWAQGYAFCFEGSCVDLFFRNYLMFLYPLRGFKPEHGDLNSWVVLTDILGRIFIGYGIYQTITAFRKYRQ